MRLINKIVDSSTTSTSYSRTRKSYNVTKCSSTRYVPSSVPSTPTSSWPPKIPHQLRKSQSISDVIDSQRGLKPSDIKDPNKRAFLNSLTQQVFKVRLVSDIYIIFFKRTILYLMRIYFTGQELSLRSARTCVSFQVFLKNRNLLFQSVPETFQCVQQLFYFYTFVLFKLKET